MAKKLKPTKKTAAKKPAPKKAPAKKKPAAKKPAPKKAPAKKQVKPIKAPKPEPKKAKVERPKKPVLVAPKNEGSKQYSQSELFDCMMGYIGFPSRKEARNFYEGFVGLVQDALKSGYRLMLPGLGKLQVKKFEARMGINPMTKEPIQIKARKRVRFTPAKMLKDAVL